MVNLHEFLLGCALMLLIQSVKARRVHFGDIDTSFAIAVYHIRSEPFFLAVLDERCWKKYSTAKAPAQLVEAQIALR